MIGMAAYFIRQQQSELIHIRQQLLQAHWGWMLIGFILVGFFLLFQGWMYQSAFQSLSTRVKLRTVVILFLKRNIVSVFLPAGGMSSLAFFTGGLEEEGVNKSQIHTASTIYGICAILSVVVVAIPVLIYAFLQDQLQGPEIWGFTFLIALSVIGLFLFYSAYQQGIVYRWILRWKPEWSAYWEEFAQQSLRKKYLFGTLGASILVELVGVAHLYVSMLALGYSPSLPSAFIGYIVMIILLVASPFLRGLGAIEVSLTYILQQYGFSLVAAAAVTLIFRFFEFWFPLLLGLISFFKRKNSVVLRVLPAMIILILGLVNVVSAITPAIPARLRFVQNLLPSSIITTSNALVLVFGLILVVVSVFLLQGSKRAWYLAMTLSLFSLLGHLFKAADYEEAILAFVAALALVITHKSYRLKPHPSLTKLSLKVVVYSFVAVFCYGVLGLYFIDEKAFGTSFNFNDAVHHVFRLFFLFDADGLTPHTHFGNYFLLSLYISGGSVLLFALYGLLKPYFSKPFNDENDHLQAKALIESFGHSALDYFKIYPDKLFFFSEDRQAFLAYKVTKHYAFVLEDPVCSGETAFLALCSAFENYCTDNGFVPVYYRVPEQSLYLYQKLNKHFLPVGEEATLDLTSFVMEGGKMKTTRSAIHRLQADGFSFHVYTPPVSNGLLQKLELVSDEWLEEQGGKEVAFTQGVFDPAILKHHTLCTIEDEEEKIYAFLNIVPDYAPKETTYDLIRKIPGAPNGVLDYLLAHTFLYLKEQGFEVVNMGLAPMSGIEGENFTERGMRYAYENLDVFAHFKGLRRYKEKFHPHWEKKYLVYNETYHLFQIPGALRAVSQVNL